MASSGSVPGRRLVLLAVTVEVVLALAIMWLQFYSHSQGSAFEFEMRPVFVAVLAALVALGWGWARWPLALGLFGNVYWFVTAVGLTHRGWPGRVGYATGALLAFGFGLVLFVAPSARHFFRIRSEHRRAARVGSVQPGA